MRTNRVVRKSIKKSKMLKRKQINRRTKRVKRTKITKRKKRTQINRKRSRIMRGGMKAAERVQGEDWRSGRETFELPKGLITEQPMEILGMLQRVPIEQTGGFGPHMLAAQRRRQGEQQREQEERVRQREEERIRQQEKIKLKEQATSRLEQYKEEEKKAEELFSEYKRIIYSLDQDQLMEILNGLEYQPYLSEQVGNIIQTSDREKLIEMVFNNTSRLRQVNKKLWNKYFDHSEIIQNYYRGSPVMETSSPIKFYNPLAKQSKVPGD